MFLPRAASRLPQLRWWWSMALSGYVRSQEATTLLFPLPIASTVRWGEKAYVGHGLGIQRWGSVDAGSGRLEGAPVSTFGFSGCSFCAAWA